MEHCITIEEVRAAATRLRPLITRTPVLSFDAFDSLAAVSPRRAFFKCELFQGSGSFKLRGASNAVASLMSEDPARGAAGGVVTHSSGNHGAALALAARKCGVPAVVVMPSNAPAVKRRAVESYGAAVVACEPTQAAREAAARRVVEERGAVFVHPSEDPRVIAGQGTIALELLEQLEELRRAAGAAWGGGDADAAPPVDAVLVPVGGGGMLSGIAVALKALDPRIRVIGAEPLTANDAFRSKQLGELQGHAGGLAPTTIADGLKTTLGPNTFPVVRDLVDEIVCVSEAEIAAALRTVYEVLKLAIEPSAAVGVAALLSEELSSARRPELVRVAVVLCGGNVDLDTLTALMSAR
jgi:threonine dehydratase